MPMEQVYGHCDKDTLKMAMLKHEETFRQQVHDLHRLYRIQKLLMRNLKREIKSQQSNLSASPNGSGGAENNCGHRAALLDVCSYEQQWPGAAATTRRGSHAAATPRAAQRAVEVEYAAQLSPEATDDEEAELELTLAVGNGAKKRYSNEHYSPGQSFSSSSTESDTLVGSREWQHQQLVCSGAGLPYHKRRPAGFDVVQVAEDGAVQQPSPLLFHWLSLRMA
ncbi:uncharacterized protein LOC124700610 [Lolium rigidum]|uniref:uncharacterized protein LOC124700610 n=1 Tax=Lolium rigidum TaxID=89674 RepID=UPI001F5C9A39|nr:uncharacterized protein LOC124700610 [Lolium rigidum]